MKIARYIGLSLFEKILSVNIFYPRYKSINFSTRAITPIRSISPV